ncbi:DinB family protein [Gelidibacter salicanalis]|uniref:DinB family protein n=1 Tax=Gelidibacter salicanalis TaxID=291193 RepID=A0A934KZE9_9FLAO|nr:DinB family protein [Gelidibacter salicanalis]MBJ7882325.1 DinB family protein [Gelidibacter salicanalis]
MRAEIHRIVNLLKSVHYGNCWTGDNYETILAEINPNDVNLKIDGFNNTIHQIVRHLITTDILIIERIKGNNIELSTEENWPSQSRLKSVDWADSLKLKNDTFKNLINHIEEFEDNQLNNNPFPEFSPWYIQFHGIGEHLHYHMAQIKLISIYQKTSGNN